MSTPSIQFKATALPPKTLRRALLGIPLLLACLTLSPSGQAVTPAPDGGYVNFNTAEGTDALFNLTTGPSNTATGYHALWGNTTGSYNTANGASALASNTTGNDNTATGRRALYSNTLGDLNTA